LKKRHWLLQKSYNVDLIPSNDFSFYDTFLDHAVLINAVDDEFNSLDKDQLDIYFAMAKGYQDEKHDIKALPMKKWFFTNYHYIVPEITPKTNFNLCSTKPFDEFKEALSCGIKTKPVILGFLTFLKLSKKQNVDIYDEKLTKALLDVYIDIFKNFENIGCEYIQIDEPILVLDLERADIELFLRFYKELLHQKGSLKIILQTYFGDIRDIYDGVIKLDFDGIALDFVDGEYNLELVNKYSFPTDKLLFAGVVNGRNVFRNNFQKSLEILNSLSSVVNKKNIVLSTSCSLLFVPYSLKHETNLQADKKRYLAFAEEKLEELNSLQELFEIKDYKQNSIYIQNIKLFEELNQNRLTQQNSDINSLTEDDFLRKPSFEERRSLQRLELNLPNLPTTTIGSFPQTKDVREARRKLKNGEIPFEEY